MRNIAVFMQGWLPRVQNWTGRWPVALLCIIVAQRGGCNNRVGMGLDWDNCTTLLHLGDRYRLLMPATGRDGIQGVSPRPAPAGGLSGV